jgi:hypothetical protein
MPVLLIGGYLSPLFTKFDRIRDRSRKTKALTGQRTPKLAEDIADLVYQTLVFKIFVFNHRELLEKFSLFAR